MLAATHSLQRLLPLGLDHWFLLYACRGLLVPQGPEHILSPPLLDLDGAAAVDSGATPTTPALRAPPPPFTATLPVSCCIRTPESAPRQPRGWMAPTAAAAAASAARLQPSKLDSKHQSPVKTRRPECREMASTLSVCQQYCGGWVGRIVNSAKIVC